MNDISKVIIPQSPSERKLKEGEDAGDVNMDVFNKLLPQIFDTMLQYSRIRKVMLTKDNPIQIGNVAFWFEVNPTTNDAQIKFNRPVTMWKQDDIMVGLEVQFHDLFYNY